MGVEWFHGTRRGFTRGGVLLPRATHAGPSTSAPAREVLDDSSDWVYVTRDRSLAWVYAWHAPGRGAPKVLAVDPHGAIERDPEHSLEMDAWRCEWARVTGVFLDPEVTETAAREGWVL